MMDKRFANSLERYKEQRKEERRKRFKKILKKIIGSPSALKRIFCAKARNFKITDWDV